MGLQMAWSWAFVVTLGAAKWFISGVNSFMGLQSKVCNEKNFSNSGAYISIGIHFTENPKVPGEHSWKKQTFDIWCIFVGQILLGLHQNN